MELKGKKIIVTGSARGMGESTLRAYVRAGADVIGMDVTDDAGSKIVDEANTEGPGTAAYLHVDIADKDSVGKAFSEALSILGKLDALAHPAAIQRSSDAGNVSVEDWDQMFAINVRGTMLTNQAAHGYMKDSGGGSIINFGSISGLRSEPSAIAYSAAKGAVHSWTRTAAGTWGKDNIRVNAILPAMATPMYLEAMERADEEQRTASYWMNRRSIALGEEYGDPDTDLAPVMIFFASDASRFITGQLIPVDGGQTSVR
ncbi:MAG: SDR family oxidoreductase [Gammaproteobacteria bacterium]|jgi:NAD(P)-dependent dehydrogenase (short-subunit alcohol dehydrogenase family)|nr:SDR family oxidoreductase [Gammaproteobacteria bacterium]MBT4494982.1 SDR family oxidoreductase [Gammaproteobacteria bacterium]MBT7371493.1 SDR family oxidoreductase [Gammaproteobacteria bacterium]